MNMIEIRSKNSIFIILDYHKEALSLLLNKVPDFAVLCRVFPLQLRCYLYCRLWWLSCWCLHWLLVRSACLWYPLMKSSCWFLRLFFELLLSVLCWHLKSVFWGPHVIEFWYYFCLISQKPGNICLPTMCQFHWPLIPPWIGEYFLPSPSLIKSLPGRIVIFPKKTLVLLPTDYHDSRHANFPDR